MALTPSDINLFAKLGRQARRGAWTDDPSDSNYPAHWNAIEASPDEHLTAAYAATLRPTGGLVSPKNMATARFTDEALYVDTPSVERIGPLGSLAGALLDRSGASTPRRIPLSDVEIRPGAKPGRLELTAPGLQVTARTDQPLGRPSELSAGDQVRRLRALLGG